MAYNVQQLCMEVIITYFFLSPLCKIQIDTIINIYMFVRICLKRVPLNFMYVQRSGAYSSHFCSDYLEYFSFLYTAPYLCLCLKVKTMIIS
jgi:hypothetical protein